MVIDTFFVNKKAVPTFTSSFKFDEHKKPKGLPSLNPTQSVSGSTVVTPTNCVEPFVTSAKPFGSVMMDVITFEIDNNKLTDDFIIYTCFTSSDNKINRMMMVTYDDLEFLQHICSRVVS